MQVTIRRFPCARVRAFVHVERVFEAACGIGDDLVEPGVGGATEQKVHLSSVAAPQTLATSG